jgi:hypothetical protein
MASDAPQDDVLGRIRTLESAFIYRLQPWRVLQLPRLILISPHVFEFFAIYKVLEPACSVVKVNGIDSTRPEFAE